MDYPGYSVEEVFDNLWKLHATCFDLHVPQTIAVGIPPSGYQAQVREAKAHASMINSRLEAACSSQQTPHPPVATYMEFPFDYEPNGINWGSDGLHFSPQGYQLLAESLVPIIERQLMIIK
jgi:lysophospholipase L1-like esterase